MIRESAPIGSLDHLQPTQVVVIPSRVAKEHLDETDPILPFGMIVNYYSPPTGSVNRGLHKAPRRTGSPFLNPSVLLEGSNPIGGGPLLQLV